MSHLGEQVRTRRESLGLSRETAAAMSGVSAGTWRNVETGKYLPRGISREGMRRALGWPESCWQTLEGGGVPEGSAPSSMLERVVELQGRLLDELSRRVEKLEGTLG